MADDEILPEPGQDITPDPIYAQVLASQQPPEQPGIGSQALSGLGYVLGLAARPVQTALHGALTGRADVFMKSGEAMFNPEVAKDFTDIRRDVIGKSDVEDKTWFGDGVGTFAKKLGLGAVDLAGNVVTDPTSLVNPLSVTKGFKAVRGLQEGVRAEVMGGAKTILSEQAARQSKTVPELIMSRERDLMDGYAANIKEQVAKNALTPEQEAKMLGKAQIDAAKLAQEVAPLSEVAPRWNKQLDLISKETGVKPPYLPTWSTPVSASPAETVALWDAYKSDLNKAIENLMPTRLGDQVKQGYRKMFAIDVPFMEGHGPGFNLGSDGSILNKVADVKDGVVQAMENTTAGRFVLDAKDYIAKNIMNPEGRGMIAQFDRAVQNAGNKEYMQWSEQVRHFADDVQRAGYTPEFNAVATEYFTVRGVEGKVARQAELEQIINKTLTTPEQQKAFASMTERYQNLMVSAQKAEDAYGVVKGELGSELKQVVGTMKDRIKELDTDFQNYDADTVATNAAKKKLEQAQGQYAGEWKVKQQHELDALKAEKATKDAWNAGVTQQHKFEEMIRNRPEALKVKGEIYQLEQELFQANKNADKQAVSDITKAIAERKAALKPLNAQGEAAIQAVRARALDAEGGASVYYARSGVSVEDAMHLGNNRATAQGIDLAGLPVLNHSADTLHGLRKGLNTADVNALEDGLTHLNSPLPRHGGWSEAVAHEGDKIGVGVAAKSEALLRDHFDAYLKTGQAIPAFQKPFAKMKSLLDADVGIHAQGKKFPALKGQAPVKLPAGPRFPAPEGLEHASLMKLNEYVDAAEKIAGKTFVGPVADDMVLKQGMADSHARLLKRAINNGESIPRAVMESHAEFTPALQKGGELWERNEKNWTRNMRASENRSARQGMNTLVKEVNAAEKALLKYKDLPERAVVEALRKEVAIFEKAIKDIPNYVLSTLSEDALRKLVAGKQIGIAKLYYGEIERQFHDLGRPLSHSEVNALISGKPHVISTVAALAGELPEATFGSKQMPMKQLFSFMSPGENDFKKIAEAASKVTGKTVTVEMARAMPIADRIKYYSQSFGKFFEERPEVVLALRLGESTKAIKNKTMVDAIKNSFSERMPYKVLDEAETVEKANIKARYRSLMTAASTADEKAALRQQRKWLLDPLNNPAIPPGYVDAELIHPDLKGRMMKRDVFDHAIKQLDSMKEPAWMKGMMQYIAGANNWWKAMQLAWPGSAIRDWMGNVMLRWQNGGVHTSSYSKPELSKMFRVMASGGDSAKLKDIVFDFAPVEKGGLGKMTGEQFYNVLLEQGVVGHGQAREVMEQSMKGLAEKGRVDRKLTSAKNWWMDKMNFFQEFERVGMFHSRLMMGDNIAAAGAAVDAALYNYGRVSPFVNLTRKTGIIPFATWSSKNIPAQLELMVKHPGQFAALLHAKRAWEGQVPGGPSQADYPEYVRDKWNLTVRRDPDTGDMGFLTLSGLIPMADLASVESPGQFMSEVMGPIPKTGFESLFNINLFTRKEMERFDGELTPLFKDEPDSFLLSKKTANAFNNVVGRPLGVVNDVIGMVNGAKDKWGEDKVPGAFNSALFGILPKQRSGNKIRDDQKREADDLARDIGVAQKALLQAQGRPGGQRAAEAYQKQLIALQEKRAQMISARR